MRISFNIVLITFLLGAVFVVQGLASNSRRPCPKNIQRPKHNKLSKVNQPKVEGVPESSDKPEQTNEKTILQLYQMMKDIHEVLVANNIEYWAIAGTLLGAVRHQGIIPWDDDLDISINKDQLECFLDLKPVFSRLGYDVVFFGELLYKIRPQNKDYPFIDVFLHKQTGNGIFYGWYNFFKYPRENRNVVIYANELFPMKDYKFGNIWVKGPNDSCKYLECCYGPDVLDFAYHGKCHCKDGKVKKFRLKDSDKVPAKPLGPLKNNLFKTLFDLQVSIETIELSSDNLEESKLILRSLKPVFMEAFAAQAESQLMEEHPEEYKTLINSGSTIKDVLAARFDKIVETVFSQLALVDASYVTVLTDGEGLPVGYAIFVQSPIKNIIQSMVSRNYIKIRSMVFDDSDLYIVSTAVLPSFQRMGQGKRLIYSMLPEHPQTKDIYLLTAESKTNLGTQKFYEHLGFKRVDSFLTSDDNLKILYRLPKYTN